ncbi:MAG: porin [Rubricoccaceae bacterium]
MTALGLAASTDVLAQSLQTERRELAQTNYTYTPASLDAEHRADFTPFGRLNLDAGLTGFSDAEVVADGFGSEIRRARLGVKGDLAGGFGYKFEIDFAGNATDVTDAIITYKDGGMTVSVGQHNTFQSLEELTSSRFSSFIERAAFTDAFGFERRLGVSMQVPAGSVLFQAGVFTDNVGDLPGQSWSADGRAVLSPSVGTTQLHLGGSVHYAESAAGDSLRYRQRPLVHFTGTRPINTGYLTTDSEFGAGVESGVIAGPLHAVSEAFWQTVNRPDALDDAQFFGGYAEVGVYLTGGDRRGYKGGRFDRTKPKTPVGAGGVGAIEVNLRYDYLDLNDGAIVGGVQNGYFASLVWVPTDHTRFLVNYGRQHYDDPVVALPAGSRAVSANVFGVRGQIDF